MNIVEISFVVKMMGELLHYVPVTLALAVSSLLLAMVIGIAGSILEKRGPYWLRRGLALYVLLGRAIPTMIMLYLVYFGLPLF
ncbi:MAG: ABC transporter permease subunit, partial [Selenomonas sp.]|nr:ABC transporter permease subunit [Selenomonas sp.]